MSRVFVALTLSEPMQQSVLFWRQNHTALPVRWIAEKNLHITLLPPWQAQNLDHIIERLRTVSVDSSPINIKFDHVSLGPQANSRRLIWALGPAPVPLLHLKQNIETALGVSPQPQSFKLHLTLARFRPKDYETFPVNTLNETVNWHDNIDSFVLIESHLLPQRAVYKIIERFLL